MGELKLYRVWRSPFSWRVEIALKLKGIEYEIIDEDLSNKSEDLLKYNPIHKKIPVLVHDGKPVSESLVILEYIDETWKNYPLLPSDPYERAQARFWAKFIDDKLFPMVRSVGLGPEEGREKAQEEIHDLLKILENEVKSRNSDGKNKVDYFDIVGLVLSYWTPVFQEAIGKEGVLTRDNFPAIYSWIDGIVGLDNMKEILPNREEPRGVFPRPLCGTSVIFTNRSIRRLCKTILMSS